MQNELPHPTPELKTSLTLWVLLCALVFIYHFGAGVYIVSRLEPSPTFEFLYSAGFVCGVVWLLRSETGRSAVAPVYCHGLLVSIGWLIILPYHLLKSRGARGLLPLAALFVSFILGQVLAAVVYFLMISRH